MAVLTNARVVQGDQVVDGGWMHWEGERFANTTLLAGLVTAPVPDLVRQISALAELVDDETVAGLHLDGPFLSPERCGAHPPDLLRAPTRGALAQVLDRRPGAARMATLAPELDGGVDAVAQLAAAGVLPAIGHTEAPHDIAHAAVDAGARVATPLFNAMRPIHHREPGVVVALMERAEVVVELINDGLHLHPSLVAWAMATVGHDRAALISDAIAAAGADDGLYALGASTVRVRDGRAELEDGSSLAGSILTMDLAFRRAVQCQGLPVVATARATATTPAKLLGLDDVGLIAPTRLANLVVLNEDLTVQAVLYRGSWVDGQTP